MATMTAADFCADEGVAVRGYGDGRQSTVCPKCSANRKAHNRRKRCLVVHVDSRGVRFTCFHCGWFKARFYDEGERHAGKTSALRRARAMARGRAQDSIRAGGQFGCGVEGREPGLRVPAERRRVVRENSQGSAGRGQADENLLDRAKRERIVLVELGLPERSVRRAVDHHGRGTRRVVIPRGRGDARRVRS
jgi:hypothetical protein